MRKVLFALLLFASSSYTQIITTNPAIITNDYAGVVEITFDAAQGIAGLKDFTGDVYAHTGVITSENTSDADWKHAPTWGDNAAKYKLTSLGNNKWKLLITPSMKGYYSLNEGEVLTKLAFVFRNSDGSKEGKDTGNKDIFVPVYAQGLNVAFTSPSDNQVTTAGGSINFSFSASQASNLDLLINGTSIKTASSSLTLSHSYSFPSVNDYLVVAKASLAGVSVYDTLRVCVPKAVETAARPSGIVDGINYKSDSEVTLLLFAPNKKKVNIIGDFSDWAQMNAYQMKKDGDYWWYSFTDLSPGKLYKFQYLVDDNLRLSDAYAELVLDPWNDGYISSETYPDMPEYPKKTSDLVATFQTGKTAYNWEVTNFSMPSKENMVIYELLLRDFTTAKTLNGAITRLDYLKTLGITAIELMPIQEFDGNNSWGYNPNHFFAPDKAYGSPEMYKKFIDECHKRGIAVLLDVVFNHATGSHPFAKLYWNSATNKTAADNPWFNVDAPHPYSVFHDFNHEYTGTKEYFKRVLQYWIKEYNIDGYRLDLTKGFTQKNSTESTASAYDQTRIDILKYYYNAAKEAKNDVMFILEHFCDNSEETALANEGMYLWRNINNAFSQAAMGYQSESNFGGLNATPRRWVGFAESHDEERNFYKAKMWGDGSVKTDSIARVKRVPLNIAFATLVPGPKMIWQFGELGYDYSIDQNGRTGEKPSAFGWLALPHRLQAYADVVKVLNLRKQFPTAFNEGTWQLNIAQSDWNTGRRIALTHSDLSMVVLGNFKASANATSNPNFSTTGTWYELISGSELTVSNTAMTIDLKPGELRIYTNKKIDVPNSVDTPSSGEKLSVYPTVTDGKVFISSATNAAYNIAVYNIQGALVKTDKNKAEIDLSNIQSGFYLIKVNAAEGDSTHKIIRR